MLLVTTQHALDRKINNGNLVSPPAEAEWMWPRYGLHSTLFPKELHVWGYPRNQHDRASKQTHALTKWWIAKSSFCISDFSLFIAPHLTNYVFVLCVTVPSTSTFTILRFALFCYYIYLLIYMISFLPNLYLLIPCRVWLSVVCYIHIFSQQPNRALA